MAISADHLSAHHAVAEQKLPGAVEGHARFPPYYFEQILGRVHGLAHILVKRDEEKDAVGRGETHFCHQFVESELIQKFDLDFLGQAGNLRPDLIGNGHPGHALIADDHQALLSRMKLKRQLDIPWHFEFFQHSGHA